MDDAELMRRTASGDKESFRLLVERYQDPIYNFFLRSTGNNEDAEDLAQNLFLNLFKSAKRYRKSASFKTYIYRIATNMAISYARKSKSSFLVSWDRDENLNDEPSKEYSLSDPSAHAEASELESRYREALSRLPPDMSLAMELRVKEGFTYREVAEILGKSIPAVESIIFRARKRLASDLEDFRKEF